MACLAGLADYHATEQAREHEAHRRASARPCPAAGRPYALTVEEVAALVADRRIARHRGQAFFTVYDHEQAREWELRGARVHRSAPGGTFCAEIHLAALLDEPTERDEDGNLIDNRGEILLAYFRERDGYETPLHR